MIVPLVNIRKHIQQHIKQPIKQCASLLGVVMVGLMLSDVALVHGQTLPTDTDTKVSQVKPSGEESPETSADESASTQPDHAKALQEKSDEATKPLAPPLLPAVVQMIDDPLNRTEQKRAMQIFHGQWQSVTNPTPTEQAMIALARYDLQHPVFNDASVPALLRATALLERGEPAQARQLLQGEQTLFSQWIVAKAMVLQGEFDSAALVLESIIQKSGDLDTSDAQAAAKLTTLGHAIVLLAEIRGGNASDYRQAMETFGKAYKQADRLYYPAMVAEASLLASRDNPSDAHAAANEAAVLNPNDGKLWSVLGHLAANHFQFEMTTRVLAQLRSINPHHLLADRLEAYSRLVSRDPASALAVLAPALARYPNDPHLLALNAAAQAAIFDQPAFEKAMDRFNAVFPQSELALLTTGRVLSMNRQYERSEAMLRQVIDRRPNLPRAWTELGLLLMQSGDESGALVALERGSSLDPFDVRAANQLKLVQELLGYQVIETEHFIIRYRHGIDEVLARDMPYELEGMYGELTSIFQHRPRNKTIVEILPDLQRFAVRITGMPDIWTIGASTGDVIAITPPRDGQGQRGAFDWLRVIKHEYVHTVTLAQTGNRIPHWFTEGAAVWQEPGDRDYNTARLLAQAQQSGQLFTLDQINWGFIRPKRQIDRPLAYAQACWMIQYIVASQGQQAVVDMLNLFNQGLTDRQAIEKVAGMDGDTFMKGFLAWANDQVALWGLGPSRYDERTKKLLENSGQLEAGVLAELLNNYPNDPDLLLLAAKRAMTGFDLNEARRAVLRYAAARPVDPWSHQMLVQIAFKQKQPLQATGPLAYLDQQEQNSGAWSVQLSRIYRESGNLDAAYRAMLRAIHREPYNATFREQTAAIALQRSDMQGALYQLQALPMLEPDRAVHQIRLAAIYKKMGRDDEANAAAMLARTINPQAPVEKFLKQQQENGSND